MTKKRTRKKKEYNKEVVGIVIILFGILSLISLFTSKTGIVGKFLKSIYLNLMGSGGFLLPPLIIVLGVFLILNKLKFQENRKMIYTLVLFFCFLILLDVKMNLGTTFTNRLSESIALSKRGLGGGLVGTVLGYVFLKLFGSVGSYIVLSFVILIVTILFTEVNIKKILKKIKLKFEASTLNKPTFKPNKTNLEESNKKKKIRKGLDKKDKEKLVINDYQKKDEGVKDEKEVVFDEKKPNDYKLPSLDLLNDVVVKKDSNDKKEVLNNAKKIESTMKSFGIEASISQINKGPTVTCYELEPAPGVKVSRITNLSDDLALNLAASGVRIEAPIPGKAAVGIEVPNKNKDNVGLKEVLQSDEYISLDSELPLLLGKDISGKSIVSTIDKMPHLLIAGATGSGKSVCINNIIMSILFRSLPSEVKLILIDPKVVELNTYNGIPHLLIPVVTDPKKAASALNWAVSEMEKRYELFAENAVRDVNSFNDKFSGEEDKKMPKIVVIIDELADLMMVSAQNVEDSISRLAQMARAAGIYLIIATQRPSVDVITGTIKANIPSRISFSVSSQIDSRTILDMGGAEKLLGKGDMLFHPSSLSKPIRVQGAFISDEEIERVVDYLRRQNPVDYNDEVINAIDNKIESNKSLDSSDELLADAIKLVVEEEQASISYLQRKLKIGYARAARLVDEMEDQNIVGGHEGSKPRKVLVSEEDLSSILKE